MECLRDAARDLRARQDDLGVGGAGGIRSRVRDGGPRTHVSRQRHRFPAWVLILILVAGGAVVFVASDPLHLS